MGETTIAGEKVKEYCKKWPKVGDMTLAKMLFKDEPILFSSNEDARNKVRYYRGHFGKNNRKTNSAKELVKPLTFDTNPFKLPESRTVKANVFNLPTSIRKVLLIGDMHIPYHDNQAIEAAVNYGKQQNVDAVFCNGDILDMYQVSFHERDPRNMSIKDELEAGRQFFAYLRSNFQAATIYYVPGNHEYRLERYLRVKAPELLDVAEFRIDVLLRVAEHNVIFIPHGSKVYFGKLLVEHGDKLRGAGGVNPARTLSLKLKRHTICHHFHRTTESISKVYDGSPIVCYSVGALCDMEPAYLPINEHNSGGAIVELLDKGEFRVDNFKIVNGKIY